MLKNLNPKATEKKRNVLYANFSTISSFQLSLDQNESEKKRERERDLKPSLRN